ncbi:helix-turn-helix domain-containing protein [Arthrobacter dokdonensis]|uniref:helix-turn-helix domain-containing protein n=1 Tax=Arthrobacter dokdonellae TaxID=2211210 RepID=UPI001D1322C7|nr:helix-turn-helix domain-containing protein [Arthrobacter dokdonellae]
MGHAGIVSGEARIHRDVGNSQDPGQLGELSVVAAGHGQGRVGSLKELARHDRGMVVAHPAKSLFVHPNTVRYRFRKAEELLQGKLTNSSLIANLYLAYQDRILALQERNKE